MSNTEFSEVITWLSVAIGKPIADSESERSARMSVYYECLGDLTVEALRIAAKRCAMERKYQSFPPIAELRELATQTAAGEVKTMTGVEAWGLAMKVINRIDVDIPGKRERLMGELPNIVQHAVNEFGFMSLYNLPNSQVETARAQFVKLFDAITERVVKTGLLPAPVQQQIAACGERHGEVRRLAERVGRTLEIGGPK